MPLLRQDASCSPYPHHHDDRRLGIKLLCQCQKDSHVSKLLGLNLDFAIFAVCFSELWSPSGREIIIGKKAIGGEREIKQLDTCCIHALYRMANDSHFDCTVLGILMGRTSVPDLL